MRLCTRRIRKLHLFEKAAHEKTFAFSVRVIQPEAIHSITDTEPLLFIGH